MSELPVFESVLRSFELVPENVQATLLLRHSHCTPIKPGTYGNETSLTTKGVRAAEKLGAALGRRQADRLLASPLVRCTSTAEALATGAGWKNDIITDWRLGNPGPFVVDASLAGPMFLQIGTVEVVQRQLTETEPLPGMRPTSEGRSVDSCL